MIVPDRATATKAGLRVEARLDDSEYLPGVKMSDEQMKELNIRRDSFHGEWNYTLKPRH